MVGRMPFLNGDKEPTARGTYLAFSFQCQGHSNPVLKHLCRFCIHRQRCTVRRRTPKLHVVGRRDRARWLLKTLRIHQSNRSSPISVAVKQRTDDATVDHPREGLVVVGGDKLHHETVVGTKRVNFQAVFVGRPASKTDRIWRIGPLHTDVAHGLPTGDTIHGSSHREKRSVDDGQGRG